MTVELIPTWSADPLWRVRTEAIGCLTHEVSPDKLATVPGLAQSIVVSFCNSEFPAQATRFRELGCRMIWVNCMTFLFEQERRFYAEQGLFDAFVFQSEFQRQELEDQLLPYGYLPAQGHLIRGAFDYDEWEFAPRSHLPGEVFVVGRMARPDTDKWSSNTWPIYSAIQYAHKRALMLGMDQRTHEKLGAPPLFADCLQPRALAVPQFLRTLHCLLPINGGARENWPRAGLEAMAAGVPIVAQNAWGWREMLEQGVTGFLGSDDCELAHFAALLAHDEALRQRIVQAARARLVDELANPHVIWERWRTLWHLLGGR